MELSSDYRLSDLYRKHGISAITGLKTADRVVTVSHGYAWELKASEGGWGLHGIIKDNDWKLRGIVNGVDNKDWNQNVQLVMLGSGRPDLANMLRQFESQQHDKIRGWVGFSVKMAHRITAGWDILLMPSRFEPCGLNQLYAMNYGTVPVVHAVGGLRDTVQPFDPFSESGLGWTFESADSGKLSHALGNCLLTYREYKKSWEGPQRRGMALDLSWDNAALQYEEVLLAAKYQW
ncbi:hypothetical protein VNO80_08335 [Phaseolus coccineus]|uniref:Starch synthase catalytic domain-containing protein n=1 Tax=Phaseolus coccineus TaxID=3886 RepID=A0AAN9NLC3_PHACN